MKRLLVALLALLFFTGCEFNADSKEYKAFKKEYGSSSRYYCDKETGFFMYQYFYQNHTHYPTTKVVDNDLDQPTRCGDAHIKVNETSMGTSRVF